MTFRKYLVMAGFFLSAIFFYGLSHAETLTPTSQKRYFSQTWNVSPGSLGPVAESVCTKYAAGNGWSYTGPANTYICATSTGTCSISCPTAANGERYELLQITIEQTCQPTYTLQNGSCFRPDCTDDQERDAAGACVAKCPAGQFRYNGTCVKDCTGKVGQSPPSPAYEFPNGGAQQVGGCEVDCAETVSPTGSVVPAFVVGKNCKYTGKSYPDGAAGEGVGFKPEKDKPKKPADCTGSGMGFIQSSSGSVTCIPSKDSPPDNKPKTTEKKTTESGKPGPDGKPDPTKPDYEKKDTSTSSGGGKTTTTETTTTNPDDSGACPAGTTKVDGKCVKTKVTTESDADFCTKNPNAAQCKAETDDQECKENPNRVGCMDAGDAPDEGAVQGKQIGVSSLTVVDLPSSAGCPSPTPMPRGLGYYNWEPMCDFASAMKPIVLAFAWLAAGLIVIGSIRD